MRSFGVRASARKCPIDSSRLLQNPEALSNFFREGAENDARGGRAPQFTRVK